MRCGRRTLNWWLSLSLAPESQEICWRRSLGASQALDNENKAGPTKTPSHGPIRVSESFRWATDAKDGGACARRDVFSAS